MFEAKSSVRFKLNVFPFVNELIQLRCQRMVKYPPSPLPPTLSLQLPQQNFFCLKSGKGKGDGTA